MLLYALFAGAERLEVSILPGQGKAADARRDRPHFELHILQVLQNLPGVVHPAVALTGHHYGAIGQGAHHQQGDEGHRERELHFPVCQELGLHYAPALIGGPALAAELRPVEPEVVATTLPEAAFEGVDERRSRKPSQVSPTLPGQSSTKGGSMGMRSSPMALMRSPRSLPMQSGKWSPPP